MSMKSAGATKWTYGFSLDNRYSNVGGAGTLYSLNSASVAGDVCPVLINEAMVKLIGTNDPIDHIIYSGSEKSYQQFQKLATQRKMAQDYRWAAQANMDARMNFGMWGPWGPWGPWY